ncbi:MAG: hypothetical protein KAW92_04300 [Candidatus Cloacimonetes bacterium]|nr:hypothetical protein [Candidatus Cloacimonadota bacterium]
MSEQVKIICENCIYWKNIHCENFSSKWFGMVTSKSQNCGHFKAKKIEKKKVESSSNKKTENKKEEAIEK